MLVRYLHYIVDTETGVIIGKYGRPLKGSVTQDGYRYIHTSRFGNLSWHRTVWIAAHGPIPDGIEINHKNGIKDDNRLANLELATRPENIQHAFRLGLLDKRGIRHPGHKLTDSQVLAIRQLRAAGGRTLREIGAEFGVSLQTVHDITTGKSWTHLKGEVA